MDSTGRLSRLGCLYAAFFGSVAVIYPFLPIYFRLRDVSVSKIGLLLGAMEVSGIFAPFIISRIADHSGKFRMVIAGSIFFSGLFLIVLNRLSTFPTMLVVTLILGFFLKPVISLIDALSGRGLANPSKNYGKVRVWGTVSFIIVSLALQITGLFESGGFQRIHLAMLVALLFPFLSLSIAPGASVRLAGGINGIPEESPRLPKGFLPFLLVCFVGNIGHAIYQSFGALYISEIAGISRVSGFFALAAFSEIPAMIFGGRIVGRIGHRRMLSIALLVGILRLSLLALFPSVIVIALSQLTHGFTYGFLLITGVDWVNQFIPKKRKALGMGLFTSLSFGGAMLVGSSLGGFLLESGGFAMLFGLAVIFPSLALVWLWSDSRFSTQ